jgi:hypothetical protein
MCFAFGFERVIGIRVATGRLRCAWTMFARPSELRDDAGLSGRRQRAQYPQVYAADKRKRHFLDGEAAPFDFLVSRPYEEVRDILGQFAGPHSELRSQDYFLVPGKNAGERRMRLPAVRDALEDRSRTA